MMLGSVSGSSKLRCAPAVDVDEAQVHMASVQFALFHFPAVIENRRTIPLYEYGLGRPLTSWKLGGN
jgi:hypothetical protein